MTDEPMPDLELLRKVLRQIDAHPELWDQSWWITESPCRTAYCVAGWAIILSGEQLPLHNRLIPIRAQELLGIQQHERTNLFYGNSDRETIEWIASKIAKRAGEPLWPTETSP